MPGTGQLAMRLVSPFLKTVLYPALSRAGVLRRTSASGLAIVTYHGVLPRDYEPIDPAFDGSLISAEMLGQQLRLLKQYYDVITPQDVLAWREGRGELPPRAVLLTCDDGLLNCLTEMLPVLKQEGARCLFFVTGASTGELRTMLWYEELFLLLLRAPAGPFETVSGGIAIRGDLQGRKDRRAMWWKAVKRLSQVDADIRASFVRDVQVQVGQKAASDLSLATSASCRRFGLLTCPELVELAAAGMTIGAHTMSHPMLSQLPAEAALVEISESKARLEAVLNDKIWAFAYPFGDPQSVTPEILGMAERAGFRAAFLNFGGGLGTDVPVYGLPRLHVTTAMSLAEFEAHVSGFYARLQRYAVAARTA
jgi:peptidoglycan/xylan/chitin deacetylase (PgdA/CDA1 family)